MLLGRKAKEDEINLHFFVSPGCSLQGKQVEAFCTRTMLYTQLQQADIDGKSMIIVEAVLTYM